MKRIGVLLIMLLMVACGNEAVSDNVKEDDKEVKQETKQDNKQDINDKLNVKTKDLFYKKYFEQSFQMDQLGIYAELENESNKPVTLTNVELSLYDKNENIISVLTDEDVDKMFAPEVLKPKGTSYLVIQLDYDDKYDDIDNIELKYDAEEVNEFAYNDMETDKLNLQNGDDDSFTITMKVINPNDETLDYEIGIGFYDKDDKFIGATITQDYTDENREVKANDNKNIELYDSVNINLDEVERTEIVAAGFLPDEY